MPDVGNLVIRACTPDDLPAMLALVRADEERVSGHESRLVEGDIRDWLQSVDLAESSWLLTAPESPLLLAVGWLAREGAELGIGVPVAADPEVLPVLVDLAERRAAELDLERLHMLVLVPDPPTERLLAARGYRDVRRFYEMAIELDGAPRAARLPDGCTLHVARSEDGPAFHAASAEAFEDHWDFHPLPFDEWWRQRSGDPEFDISWWFLVRHGEETVAAIRNIPARNGGVYVASLGVRRNWRGRGVAKALLLHTFGRAYEAGFRRITLGVDASNPTGATALYRSVGMISELESAVWEKRLSAPGGT